MGIKAHLRSADGRAAPGAKAASCRALAATLEREAGFLAGGRPTRLPARAEGQDVPASTARDSGWESGLFP